MGNICSNPSDTLEHTRGCVIPAKRKMPTTNYSSKFSEKSEEELLKALTTNNRISTQGMQIEQLKIDFTFKMKSAKLLRLDNFTKSKLLKLKAISVNNLNLVFNYLGKI